MKRIFFCIIFILNSCVLTQAQDIELSSEQRDSIYQILQHAFELNDKSQYGKSIEISLKTLTYLEDSKDYVLQGLTHSVLAYAYSELEDKDKAFNYSFKSRDCFIKAKDTVNAVFAYNNLGVTYNDFDMQEEANATFKEALRLAELSKDSETIISPCSNIAHYLIVHKKKYEEALSYLNKALYYAKDAGIDKDNSIFGYIYFDLWFANYKLKQFKAANKFFKMSHNLAEENEDLKLLEDLYEKKAELFIEEKKYLEALNMKDKYLVIHDSINKIDNIGLAKTIETKYKVKESEEKLIFLKKEQEIQEAQLEKSYNYNIILIILIALLALTVYWIIKKNRELQIARDIAENLSRVKSDFYSEISHELRTPLYAVIELSSLMLRENVNTKHKEYLESLKFSGNHLLSLINNVLELNKIDSPNKTKVEALEFNLKRLVNNIIDSLEYALNDSNNKIHLNYDSGIPNIIIGDSLKISQVLINLISNAIKFTNNGNINILISKKEATDKDIKIYFSVADDGLGIPKEKQSQVFENFYQEQVKTKRSYKGTGLGLSIVKRMVNLMGGDIKIKSEENIGTSFFFELEFSKSDKLKLSKVAIDCNVILKGTKILVVDDNRINQMVTKKVLEQLDLKSVITVDSGEKAIAVVKTEQFDCILMDLHMPGLDGYETTKLIRVFNKDIPIIALTATSINELENKVKDYEIDNYILKPFITENFIDIISKTISTKTINKTV